MTPVDDVWSFWFGALDPLGSADAAHTARWWRKSPEFDAEIHERFARLHGEVAGGEHEAWRESARGAVAYVVVLDQLSRNMFRDTGAMFASDARALGAAKQSVAAGQDLELPYDARSFLYMPYMHSESLADQDTCVQLFTALADSTPREHAELRARRLGQVTFADKHRVIVQRFGRFPHRNALLGRPSTPEELAFLTEPGSSF